MLRAIKTYNWFGKFPRRKQPSSLRTLQEFHHLKALCLILPIKCLHDNNDKPAFRPCVQDLQPTVIIKDRFPRAVGCFYVLLPTLNTHFKGVHSWVLGYTFKLASYSESHYKVIRMVESTHSNIEISYWQLTVSISRNIAYSHNNCFLGILRTWIELPYILSQLITCLEKINNV